MKLNDFIKTLQHYQNMYGNMDVAMLWDMADAQPTGRIFITDEYIVIDIDTLSHKLPKSKGLNTE